MSGTDISDTRLQREEMSDASSDFSTDVSDTQLCRGGGVGGTDSTAQNIAQTPARHGCKSGIAVLYGRTRKARTSCDGACGALHKARTKGREGQRCGIWMERLMAPGLNAGSLQLALDNMWTFVGRVIGPDWT